MSDVAVLKYKKIKPYRKDCVAVLTLTRPQAANAFNKEMIEGISKCLDEVKHHKACRALIIKGEGKHFSAGADLKWMKASQELSFDENKDESLQLMNMFEKLYRLPKPSIAMIHGAVYGGAVGLVSCCDIAIATQDTRFCFSEIKLGLVPAVILPYLAKKIAPAALRRLGLTGQAFDGEEAFRIGLINYVGTVEECKNHLFHEVNQLLSSAPDAMTHLKQNLQHLVDHSLQQSELMVDSIATIRIGEEAQMGMASFFAKETPDWVIQLDTSWTIYD